MVDQESTQTDPGDRRPADQTGRGTEEAVEFIAASSVRILLLILGSLLLLYSVGQIVGFDAMAMLSDALATREARWTIVAFFALILILVSLHGFRK